MLTKSQRIANVCDFGLRDFGVNGPLQLIFLCDFTLEVAVDRDQACLMCATKILFTFERVAKVKWLNHKLQRFSMCVN